MSASPKSAHVSAMLQNLSGIALGMMLAALGAAYLVDRLGNSGTVREPSLTDGSVIVQTVGGQELTVPESWFRFGEQMESGFVSQVDLTVRLPLGRVDVTLLPRSRTKASSELLDTVYLHQFKPGQISAYPGLVGQRLEEREGFAGETVWYDALAPRPFVAKCIAAVEPGTQDKCIRTVHLASGLAAIYSFEADILKGWREFDAEIALWLERIGAI